MKKILGNVNVPGAWAAKQSAICVQLKNSGMMQLKTKIKGVKCLALLFCFFTLKAVTVFGQWTTSGTNIYNSNSGNVGIGITAPASRLEVNSGVPGSSGLQFTQLNSSSATVTANGKLLSVDTKGQVILVPAGGESWGLTGNAGTNSSSNFIGTTNNVDLIFKRNNVRAGFIGMSNTSFGNGALNPNTTGSFNTANGVNALYGNTTGYSNTANGASALYSNITGYLNTAHGVNALYSNTTGYSNTANGASALYSNTTGNNSTANGVSALYLNTTGSNNTANGASALSSNTTGSFNTANGYAALYWNTSDWNTANGYQALYSNTTGSNNTANGANALYSNITGNYNTANGIQALYSNTTGSGNIANGYRVLYWNTTGNYNIANGYQALLNNTTGNDNIGNGRLALYSNTTGSNNTANGVGALLNNTTGSSNTALGQIADVATGNLTNATAIGYSATVNASNKIRLGNTFVTVIEGQVAYTVVSDGRFKSNISESDVKGLEFINRLRPVVYNFDTRKFEEFLTRNMPDSIRARHSSEEKNFRRSTAVRQSGFIAQEVEKAAKEAGYDFNGVHAPESKDDNYSLAYSQFTIPLVKAVQELSKHDEEVKKEIEELKKENEELRELIKNVIGGKVDGSIQINGSTTAAKLFQNAPNPFTQSTTILYSLPAAAKKAVLSITSVNGAKLKEYNLINNNSKGVEITGGQFAAGTYIYSLIVDGILVDSKKMILTH